MTNEIKEIIEYIEDKNIYVDENDYCYKRISLEECSKISDYINNLQDKLKQIENYILENMLDYSQARKDLLDIINDK